MPRLKKYTDPSNINRMDHISNVIRHSIKRAKERYNLNLTLQDLNYIVRVIQKGATYGSDYKLHKYELQFIKKISRRKTIWKLNYKGKTVYVAYDKEFKLIRTFLKSSTYCNFPFVYNDTPKGMQHFNCNLTNYNK